MDEQQPKINELQPTVLAAVGRKKGLAKYRLILPAIPALIILAGVGFFAYSQWHNRSILQAPNLKTLSSYKLAGSSSGRGIVFEKPTRLVNDPTSTNLPLQVAFTYVYNNRTVAYVIAFSSPKPSSTYQTTIINNTPQVLVTPKSPNYASYSIIPQGFIVSNVSRIDRVNYSSASPFTSNFIKTNAWRIDFTVTNPSINQSGQGSLVYVLGRNTYYYFMIFADKNNWQSNQPVWNQLLTSLKADQ
jgi:hypothetical protein